MRHKIMTAVLAFVVLSVIASAAGGSQSHNGVSSNGQTTGEKQYRFADRSDKQKTDVEAVIGETATVGKVKLTVTSVDYKTSLGQFETADSGKTYAVVNLKLENTDTSTQPYNQLDFRMQTASGQVLDSTISASVQNLLNSGDLVAGGTVTGAVVFELPQEAGHQYVIWKPSAFGSDRAIIQAK